MKADVKKEGEEINLKKQREVLKKAVKEKIKEVEQLTKENVALKENVLKLEALTKGDQAEQGKKMEELVRENTVLFGQLKKIEDINTEIVRKLGNS